jgi:Transposase
MGRRSKRERQRVAARARRFTEEQRTRALGLLASGMTREKAAKAVGTTTESLRVWSNRARAQGKMPPPDPARDAAAENLAVRGVGFRTSALARRMPASA